MPTSVRPCRRGSIDTTRELIVVIAFAAFGLLLTGAATAATPFYPIALGF